MLINGNSSHGIQPGELKKRNKQKKKTPLDIALYATNTPCTLLNPVHLGTNVDTQFILDTIFMGDKL